MRHQHLLRASQWPRDAETGRQEGDGKCDARLCWSRWACCRQGLKQTSVNDLDNFYTANGFTPPSEMTEEQLSGDDFRSSLVLNAGLAFATGGRRQLALGRHVQWQPSSHGWPSRCSSLDCKQGSDGPRRRCSFWCSQRLLTRSPAPSWTTTSGWQCRPAAAVCMGS